MLREHLGAAIGGHGALVLIGGEAGIGKTAVAAALCRDAEAHGAFILVGRCYDLSETPPYGPWVDLFGHYRPADTDPPLPDAFAQQGTVGAVTSQSALFQQMLDFFTALTAAHPLVLLLDDQHWADPASLDLLRFLARHVADLPLLLIVTYRTDELTRRHPLYQLLPALVREANATRIALQSLEVDAMDALVRARFSLSDADTTRLVAYLHARGEGNPFFVGELLQTLIEERVLRERDDGGTLGDLAGVQVPPLLRQVIDARLARLGAEDQHLLGVAAVIGQEVPLALWAAVAERDEEALLTVVEQAAEAHLITVSRDGARVQFAHALIREALYEGVLPLRRRVWHRRAGEALIALPHPDPDVVAYHFREAGDARAYEWLVQAGDRAQRAYAYIVAADRFEAALTLLETSDATAGERGWHLRRLARLRRMSDPRQGIAYLDEAIASARQADDQLLLATALYDRGMLLNFIQQRRRGLADMEAGIAALRGLSAMDRARLKSLPTIFALADSNEALTTVALMLTNVGRYTEAYALAERLARELPEERPGEARDGSVLGDAYFALARSYAALGLPEQAQPAFARARSVQGRRASYDGRSHATDGDRARAASLLQRSHR
jgi:tetratricopeptide (TPR) repeat protein